MKLISIFIMLGIVLCIALGSMWNARSDENNPLPAVEDVETIRGSFMNTVFEPDQYAFDVNIEKSWYEQWRKHFDEKKALGFGYDTDDGESVLIFIKKKDGKLIRVSLFYKNKINGALCSIQAREYAIPRAAQNAAIDEIKRVHSTQKKEDGTR